MRIAILAFITMLTPLAVQARGYTATYDVYAGGIHALQATMNSSETTSKYDVFVTSQTYGILNKIVPWHASFHTRGSTAKGQHIPNEHVSDTTTRKKHEINSFHYSKDGAFKDFTQVVDGQDVTAKDIDPSIPQGTTDVLTSVVSLISQVAAGKGCAQETMLFDSERSYRLIFKDGKSENLKPSQYSSFSGDAVGCIFEIKPEGGKWHKKPRGWMKIQEQAKKSGQPPMIYFANVSTTDKPLFAPVRTVIKTDLGTFIAHMTSFEEKPVK